MGIPSSHESDPGVDSLTYRKRPERGEANDSDAEINENGIPRFLHKDPDAAADLINLLVMRTALVEQDYFSARSIRLKTLSTELSYYDDDDAEAEDKRHSIARMKKREDFLFADDANELLHLNTFKFVEPIWAPSFYWRNIFSNGCLFIDLIYTNPGYRNVGMGRAFVNALQQGLASTTDGIQTLCAHTCYFPTFYCVDSHFHWIMRSKWRIDRQKLDNLPPPRTIYMLHLFPFVDEAGNIPDPIKEQENKEAIYYSVDLYWSTPYVWHERRIQNVLGHDHDQLSLAAILWIHYAAYGQFLHIGDSFITPPLRLSAEQRPITFSWQLMVLESLGLGPKRIELATKIGEGLRVLGNVDYNKIGGGALDHDVLAIFFPRSAIQPVEAAAVLETKTMFLLILAFLIDCCRVFFQPMVLDYVLVERLFGSLDGFNSALNMGEIISKPLQYFAKIENDPPLHPLLLWVPVKKPHSTSTYEGRDVLPMPEWEDQPMFSVLAEEPPMKRARLSCKQCGFAATHHDMMHPFCSTRCQGLYYYV